MPGDEAQPGRLQVDEPEAVPARGVTDGRVARRDRNRIAVLDAAIAMFAEGNLQPVPSEVANRCGISRRSIDRYFPDNRSLLRAAVDRQIEVGIPLYRIHAIGTGSLAHRIEEFVRVRLDGYEVLGATARAATLLGSTSRMVRTELAAVRDLMTEQVDRQFAVEFETLPEDHRQASRMAIDALFQFETLDFYRRLRGLGIDEAHDLLSRALADLLTEGRTASTR